MDDGQPPSRDLIGAGPGGQRQALRRQRFAGHGIYHGQGSGGAGRAVNYAQRRPGQLGQILFVANLNHRHHQQPEIFSFLRRQILITSGARLVLPLFDKAVAFQGLEPVGQRIAAGTGTTPARSYPEKKELIFPHLV